MSAPQLPSPAPSPFPGAGSTPVLQDGPGQATNGHVDPDRLRADLEVQLLRLSQDLYEMEVCAGEVGPGMEDAVPKYMEKISKSFATLSEMAGLLTDSVPWQIVDIVDRYKNPHQHTKTTLSRATGENQYALGRVLGLESFRRQLHDALAESFPAIELPKRAHNPVRRDPATEETKAESFDQEVHGEESVKDEDKPQGQVSPKMENESVS